MKPLLEDWIRRPSVVGTISQPATLALVAENGSQECDVVEVRLDQVGVDCQDWLEACAAVEGHGLPVLLTVRHAAEGGAWSGNREERLDLYRTAMAVVSAVDIEIHQEDVPTLVRRAEQTETVVIGSFHDFDATPAMETLTGIVEEARSQGADLVKLATWVDAFEDEQILRLLMNRGEPLAIVGMGPRGPETRVAFPKGGSCLTYGFLDRSVATGQVSAASLKEQLAMQ